MTTINGIEAHLLTQRISEDRAKHEKFHEGEGKAQEGIENLRRLFPGMAARIAEQDKWDLVDQEIATKAGPKAGRHAHVSIS